MTNNTHQLWCAVLALAVHEALEGVSTLPAVQREAANQEARDYFMRPDPDLAHVCHLAGLDPDAVRERVVKLLTEPKAEPKPKAKPKRGRPTKLITAFGQSLTLDQWATETGIKRNTLSYRINGLTWPLERALTEPVRSDKSYRQTMWAGVKVGPAPALFEHDGRSLSLRQWAEVTGISHAALQRRLYTLRWPLERVLTEPVARPRGRHHASPGVGSNFGAFLGTGGGPSARETTEIAFAEATP